MENTRLARDIQQDLISKYKERKKGRRERGDRERRRNGENAGRYR